MTTKAHTPAERRLIAGLLLSVIEANTVAPADSSPAEQIDAIPPAEREQLGPAMIRLLKKTFS
jgi:hypothetical protein